jgi:hypothetical protein
MKTKDIAKSLRRAVDRDGGKKKGAIKKVLKKLKQKDIKLKKQLDAAKKGKEKKAILAKLKVNRAHRKKGVKILRDLGGKV